MNCLVDMMISSNDDGASGNGAIEVKIYPTTGVVEAESTLPVLCSINWYSCRMQPEDYLTSEFGSGWPEIRSYLCKVNFALFTAEKDISVSRADTREKLFVGKVPTRAVTCLRLVAVASAARMLFAMNKGIFQCPIQGKI